MDKYQKYIFESSRGCCGLSVCGKHALENVVYDDKIVFKQNEDITITDYVFYIANIGIQSVFAVVGETGTPLAEGNIPTSPHYRGEAPKGLFLPINFDNKIDFIKIVFKNNLADDLIFPVQYVEADKDLYYQKQEADRKANMLQSAQIKHSTGTDLINIYFQPCCSDYEYTEIYLYIPQDYVTVGGPYGPVKKPSSWQLFKKCKVPSEDFYKSINGLAYGTYAYVIKQFDKKDNMLLETEYIEFSLKAPKQPIMGRINRI